MTAPQTPSVKRVLTRTRRRLNLALFLGCWARSLGPAFFLLGAVILAGARLEPSLRSYEGLSWLAALAGSVLIAAWRSRPRRWSSQQSAQLLDSKIAAGGLLLTLRERPDPRWAPYVTWRSEQTQVGQLAPGSFAGLIPGALFLLVALAVPARSTEAEPVVAVGRTLVRELKEKLDDLDRRGALAQGSKAKITRNLSTLSKSLDLGEFGASQWETIEALRERLKSEERRSGLSLGEIASRLKSAGWLSPEGLGSLSDGEAEKLAEAADGALQDLGLKLPTLAKGLLGHTLKSLAEEAREGDIESLAERARPLVEIVRQQMHSASPQGLQGLLSPERLSGVIPLLRQVKPRALGRAEGPAASNGPGAIAARDEAAPAPGDLVHRQRVLPRHRGIVKRYFGGEDHKR